MQRTPAPNRRAAEHRDPVETALRRLLTATDKNIAATEEVRRARVELAKVVEGKRNG